jgi:hypothetical protein
MSGLTLPMGKHSSTACKQRITCRATGARTGRGLLEQICPLLLDMLTQDGVRLLPDPALLRRKGDDRAAVTEQVMQLNGWDRASMPHATSAVLTQLGR